MIDLHLIKTKINKLEEYHGDTDIPSKEEIVIFKRKKLPCDYISFIKEFGYGLIIEDCLNLWDTTEDSLTIYSEKNKILKGTLVFGENLSGEMFIFNPKNNWEVLVVFANGDIEKKFDSFDIFINNYLDSIIEANEL